MKKSEREAVVRLVRHMQQLQCQITEPDRQNATDEEVRTLFDLFWEWTPTPRYPLPSKTIIENLVGLMRGLPSREYCYINRAEVARIIRETAMQTGHRQLAVYLKEGWETMTDTQLYDEGRWNYKETPIVGLLWNLHVNPDTLR